VVFGSKFYLYPAKKILLCTDEKIDLFFISTLTEFKNMDWEIFVESLKDQKPPNKLSPLLEALWYEGKDDWDRAHNIAQDIETNEGSWVHAYLHRVEGDRWNANYWYRRAGRSMPEYDLKREWEELVRYFLGER
jgi:hypothetical protein